MTIVYQLINISFHKDNRPVIRLDSLTIFGFTRLNLKHNCILNLEASKERAPIIWSRLTGWFYSMAFNIPFDFTIIQLSYTENILLL